MQTSGVLIHLAAHRPSSAFVTRLEEYAGLTLGERNGNLWPAVIEAADGRASATTVRELESHREVVRVDVVFVGTDTQVQPRENGVQV